MNCDHPSKCYYSLYPTILHKKSCGVQTLYRFQNKQFQCLSWSRTIHLAHYFRYKGTVMYFYFSYSKYLRVKEIAIVFAIIFSVRQ